MIFDFNMHPLLTLFLVIFGILLMLKLIWNIGLPILKLIIIFLLLFTGMKFFLHSRYSSLKINDGASITSTPARVDAEPS